jgi:hypothetical protein
LRIYFATSPRENSPGHLEHKEASKNQNAGRGNIDGNMLAQLQLRFFDKIQPNDS